MIKEAKFYKVLKNKKVKCQLCRHFCTIENGEKGFCNVRKNDNGSLKSLNYGELVAINVDPVEKKPLYHFLPKTLTFSIASYGCNFRCLFCQNHSISQNLEKVKEYTPDEIVYLAIKHNCKSISYTYTEPTIFYEFMYDTAKIANQKGLKNIMVTNGYIAPEPLKEIAPFIDAANIDLKAFNSTFYEEFCFANLEEVKKSIKTFKKENIFIEITTLIIPSLNDNKNDIIKLAKFIQKELGNNTPWHISRFHPAYKINDIEPTSITTLQEAKQIGKEAGLNYIYIGNVNQKEDSGNSFCHNCKNLLVEREGFFVKKIHIKKNNLCHHCNKEVPFLF